jgi:preprotein translocase subunit SecB
LREVARDRPENFFMSTTNGGAANAGAQAEAAQPQLNVLAQYVKDLSFENPNAPRSLQQQQAQPSINIQINVNAKPLSGNEYEIELKIEGRAEIPNPSLFLFGFDLLYAGVFRIVNVPQENLHPVIMIECPRLLFPFARELIATAVRNGGFPPLMIDPVDFVSLYRQKVAESQPQPGPTTA